MLQKLPEGEANYPIMQYNQCRHACKYNILPTSRSRILPDWSKGCHNEMIIIFLNKERKWLYGTNDLLIFLKLVQLVKTYGPGLNLVKLQMLEPTSMTIAFFFRFL